MAFLLTAFLVVVAIFNAADSRTRVKRACNPRDLEFALYYQGWRTLSEMARMSCDDKRNTVIVEVNKRHPHLSISQLQGWTDKELVEKAVSGQKMIESNKVTNYGDWGDWEYCPPRTFAMGFQLKVEGRQGGGDDTALNAIKLYCAIPGWKAPSAQTVSSKQGSYGNWRVNHLCSDGIMTAFRLRSEPPQGGGSGDDTAANNIEMRCNVNGYKQDLMGDGMDYGSWQPWKHCPSGLAICAIRTQVEEPQGGGRGGDDTSLNNVQFKCCDPMEYGCRAEDKWEEIWRCENPHNTATTTCKYSQTTGFQWTKSVTMGKHWSWTNGEKIGVSVGAAAKGFSASISSETTRTETTGYNWSNSFSSAWTKSTTREVSSVIPPQTSVSICQAVAMCDGMVVSRAPLVKTDHRC